MVFMRRSLVGLLSVVALFATTRESRAEAVTATLVKVRGTVTQGASTPLKTGATVGTGSEVSVGRMSTAVYQIAPTCVIKQEPGTSISFNRLDRSPSPGGTDTKIRLSLQRGEIYTALVCPKNQTVDYHVVTSRIEAFSHDAIFKVAHSGSTSTVMVAEGTVEILYCRRGEREREVLPIAEGEAGVGNDFEALYRKRAIVHAGEVFVVTDCQGIQRWFNEDEARQMALFSAVTDSAFAANPFVHMPLNIAVLAPEIPPDLPLISP